MEKETEILEQYIEDLKNIPAEAEGEKAELLGKLKKGEASVKSRLSELCLMKAMQTASEYRGQGLPLVDLIQESSMAVMLGIEEYSGDATAEAFDKYLDKYVREHIKTVVAAESAEKKAEDEITEKINVLSDTAQALAERFDREATLEELKEYTKLTEDEIKTLMKMSLDAL